MREREERKHAKAKGQIQRIPVRYVIIIKCVSVKHKIFLYAYTQIKNRTGRELKKERHRAGQPTIMAAGRKCVCVYVCVYVCMYVCVYMCVCETESVCEREKERARTRAPAPANAISTHTSF